MDDIYEKRPVEYRQVNPRRKAGSRATDKVEPQSPLIALQSRINRLETALTALLHHHSSMAAVLDTVMVDLQQPRYLYEEAPPDLESKLREALRTVRPRQLRTR